MSMKLKLSACIPGAVLMGMALYAADVEGTIVIKRRLTKPRVTAPSSSYQRGPAVELRSDQPEDFLALERTRTAIWLEGSFPSRPQAASMEQKDRRFLPDTLVLPAGSTVSFPNRDAIFHNVFSLSKPKTFDLGNYAKDHTRTVTFLKPGIVFVNCHLHPNMAAAIVITPNQWSARSGPDGQFSISSVPPGSYTIVAWHRAAGFFRQTVKVTENRPSNVRFIIPVLDDTDASVMAQR